MTSKLKNWLSKQKNDVKTLSICFIIAFILYLIITQDFYNALGSGFVWVFLAAMIINAVRFWRWIAKKVGGFIGVPTAEQYHIELDEKEKIILNELVALPNIKELSSSKKIDGIIKEKILSNNCCTEDWQIHYVKERIKNAITKYGR